MGWSQVVDKLLPRLDIKFSFIMHSIFLISLLSIILLVYGPTQLLDKIAFWEKPKTLFKYLVPYFLIDLIFELAYWRTKIDESRTKSKKMDGLSTEQQKVLYLFSKTKTRVLGKTSAVLSLEKMGILRYIADEMGERAIYLIDDWYYNYLKKRPGKEG